MRFLRFSLVFLMLRIVFYVFSIKFAKTSLLFFLTSHPILRCELCFLRHLFSSVLKHCVVPYCVMQTTIVFRIMFFQIRVFRKLSRYGLVRVINYAYVISLFNELHYFVSVYGYFAFLKEVVLMCSGLGFLFLPC